ncbi:DUF5985 family protein [Alsobacter sp. SYSU BS001988]|jgi:hypothetical protein
MNIAQLSFLSGAVTMGYLAAALFFAKFWRKTRDSLFVMFSIAFALLALEQVILAGVGSEREEFTYVYLIRFVAFSIIALAIINKNRGR